MFLARLHQTLMGKSFGIARITLRYGMPCLLCFSIVAGCFQGQSVCSASLGKCRRVE